MRVMTSGADIQRTSLGVHLSSSEDVETVGREWGGIAEIVKAFSSTVYYLSERWTKVILSGKS